MNIDERLANTNFPLPTIREVNMSKHPTGISLGLGELKEFPVNPLIIETLTNSLNNNGTSYTQNAGLPELRKAIAESQKKQDNYNYTQNNVVVGIGVQNTMYSSIKTLVKLGAKRILIPEINFGIYKKIPSEFGLEVKTYPLTEDFGVDLNKLESILNTDDLFILNSPANPTGRVFTTDEQKDLASLFNSKLNDGYVISDEIYGKLIYDGENPGSFSKYFDKTIVLDGISKSGASAGLRVGWAITKNETLAKAITSNNASIISSPPTANQYAAIPVVNGSTQNTITNYNLILKNNRDYVIKILDKLSIPYNLPKGSFYIFPDLKDRIGDNSRQFCLETAKKENGVVVIPGMAFGAASNIRISLATNQIEEGMSRLEKALKEY